MSTKNNIIIDHESFGIVFVGTLGNEMKTASIHLAISQLIVVN